MLIKAGQFFGVRLVLILVLILGMLGIPSPRPVLAAPLTVTNANDSGTGSLRQAIANAASGDTITFDPSLAGQTTTLASPLTISKNLTIDGSGLTPPLTLSGGDTTQIIQIMLTAQVAISDLVFTKGFATTGGAIDLSGTTQLTLDKSTFKQNHSSSYGGAVTVRASSVMTVSNSVFDQNQTAGSGGAIYGSGSGPITILNSTFSDNSATGSGGAIRGGTVTLTDCTLSNNIAGSDGGAIVAFQATIKNTVIYSNQASDGGAILMQGNGIGTIVNSTITQNQASSSGGAISLNGNVLVQVFNSTFAANNAPQGSEINATGVGSIALSNTILACIPRNNGCIFQFGSISIGGPNTIIDTGTPDAFGLGELADNGGPTKTMALLPGSPLIDAGDDTICENDPVNGFDQRGAPRPQGKHCDIGAVEKDVPTYRVAPNGVSDPSCGADWAHPCDLNYALTNLATADAEIWAKEGIYVPGATRTTTFQLVDGVELYGGFAGTERTYASRDPAAHITILSGDLNGNDNANIAADEPTRAENAYHVVSSSRAGSDTILDGITITGGNGNGNLPPFNCGGGMYNASSDPTLTNVLFRDNSAIFGAGMYNDGEITLANGSNPILTNVSFLNNAATEGGGMENMNYSSPRLTRVVFRGNKAVRSGGGMLNFNYSSPTLTDVTLSDNTASVGGGLMNWMGNNPALMNVTFDGNSASEAGGGMSNYQSSPSLTNITFSGNSARQHGGGMYNDDGGNPILTNVTFSGNQAPVGAGLFNEVGSHPKITNSILYGDLAEEVHNVSGTPVITYSIVQGGYPGLGNLGTDPLLGPLQDNGGFTQTRALGAASPAIGTADDVNCPPTDQRGITRPQGVACDMGSYEYYEGLFSARETVRVSVDSNGLQANDSSDSPSISADGRYIAFSSLATNLVPGSPSNAFEVFVRDMQTGITTCVSVDSTGVFSSGPGPLEPSISADGRYVAFRTGASNLVPGDTNNANDVFVHDRQTGTTTRVSVSSDGAQANQSSYRPSISADGRYVAFHSDATNLVPDDTNAVEDVFVHDMQTGTTRRVSLSSNGIQGNDHSFDASISADGRFIAFVSRATTLVPGDSNGFDDIFLHDMQTGSTILVSSSSSGIQGNNYSGYPSLSADGRYIAFTSPSSNLVPGDTNANYDVFVRDIQNSLTTLVSVSSSGVQGNGYMQDVSISADGRYVVFGSGATNLIPDDTNGRGDIFVHDNRVATTTRVSIDSNGAQGNSSSVEPAISADGQYIAFASDASNLVPGDTNGWGDVFLHRQNILPAPPPVDVASLKVYMAGSNIDNLTVPFHTTKRLSYAGMNNGPVRVSSTDSTPLLASERVIYKAAGNVNTSFTEMMALPDSQLDKIYWLPWYNNADLDTQLRIGNVSNSTATVNVYIGGTLMTPTAITLVPGESTRRSFVANKGPVKIVSNVNIVAAERVIYKTADNVNTSFSEMMALPNNQLNTAYWLPWYNNADLDTQLRIGNVSANPATVHIFIGGTEVTPAAGINLGVGASTRLSYPSVNNGPVKIQSNQNVVAAERVIYKVNGLNTSFTEMMALPDSQLNTMYWLPWYNNADLDTQLRFGNGSGNVATIHIFIGETEVTPVSGISLASGASIRLSYPHVNNGPVKIQSNQNIVAAERVIYKVNGVNTSFSEMMALPDTHLNATYWLPWYNNVDLDTQLRFGVP